MTTGSISSGGTVYYTGYVKTWSGADDLPAKKAWNPYVVTVESFQVNPGEHDTRMGLGMNFSQSPWDSNDDLKLLDKLANKVRGHSFNAGVFVGQAGEVASSVVGTAKAFKSVVTSLKKGNLDGALRSLARSVSGDAKNAAKKKMDTKDISGAFLSLSYGWVPLISDIHEAAVALEAVSVKPRKTSVVVTRSRQWDVEASQSPSNYSCIGLATQGRRLVYTMEEYLPVARSLGLTDPASVIWELVPDSFVVDWFIPIGTYLSNLAVIPYLKGTFQESKVSRGGATCTIINPYYNGGSSSCREVHFQRLAATSSLNVPLPAFKGFSSLWSSANRVAQATALIRNLFK